MFETRDEMLFIYLFIYLQNNYLAVTGGTVGEDGHG